MVRHLDVLANAFRFYGALVFSISGLASVLCAVAALFAGEPALVLGTPVLLAAGALIAAPFALTGRGIDRRRPWARIVGMILSVMVIGDLPFGLGLGLLGLGVLTDPEVARAFPVAARSADRADERGTADLDAVLKRASARSARLQRT